MICGIPDPEGNAVEVARRLVAEKGGQVTWLTETGERAAIERTLAGVPHLDSLQVVRKGSIRGIAHFLTDSRASTPTLYSPQGRSGAGSM